MALGGVGQFADVARPIVGEQAGQLGCRQRRSFAAELLAGQQRVVLEQQRDVLAAFAQGRLGAANQPSGGAVFRLSLPAASEESRP